MDNSRLSPNYVLTEHSFNQASLVTATVSQVKDETIKPQIIITPTTEQVVASICSIIICSIGFFILLSSVWKFRPDEKLTSKRLQKLPCKNCRYFKDNHYLNCAVHPSIVLTEQALNCPDYYSNK
ncbi:MAG: hypothetical protein PUP91_27965 [Rhizonema sp. PD37]|nr:hypothetical protein [Rhizonema sp. PD37]